MQKLSIHEKISIKGKLARKGVNASVLVVLDRSEAMRLHWACYGKPVNMHSTPKMWRRKTPRAALMH